MSALRCMLTLSGFLVSVLTVTVTKGSSQLFFFWVMGVGLKVPISLIMCDPGLAPLTLSSGLLAMKPSCVPI